MADAPDPITEKAPEPNGVPVQRRKPSLFLPVAGGAIAAIIGFGVAQIMPGLWPQTDTAAIDRQLAAQATELLDLRSKLAQAASTAVVPDKDLSNRVSALETTVAGLQPAADTQPMISRLEAVEQSIAAMSAAVGTSDPTGIAELRAEVNTLKAGGIPTAAIEKATAAIDAKLADADTKIAAIKAEAEAFAKSAAQRAALRQLQAALDTGAPYSSALADLSDIALPAVVTDSVQSGLPTLQTLRASFPDAARAALDATHRVTSRDQSWTERFGSFLRGQTGARSLSPREGSDPDAILSRAEANLAAGDLTAALAELSAMPAEGKAALADWTARATQRQQAAAAIQAAIATAGI